MTENKSTVVGRNGVVVSASSSRPEGHARGYRTYEVHQRERVGESTEKIKPIQLVSEAFRRTPYSLLEILRENYPCYRDWLANCYWLTKYNDVTSVFADDANFESRAKIWYYGIPEFGRNLGEELDVLTAEAQCMDAKAEQIAADLAERMANNSHADFAREFAARLPLELLAILFDIPNEGKEEFFARYWRAQRGVSWVPALQQDGLRALHELVDFFDDLIIQRRQAPGSDLVSILLQLDVAGGPVTARDVAVTLLERDHETLHGSLANMWCMLLTHPEEFAKAKSERRLLKLAYLETMRHSAPVLSAKRYARHEVERFGKLLPDGALVVCSAAANRDPRIFADPDTFMIERKDLCQREPRGQYRADGLASGIAFGLGKPSIHPAVPEQRPRSRYALNRDTVVATSTVLLEALPNLELAPGATPYLSALTVGEMHTCWRLPVIY